MGKMTIAEELSCIKREYPEAWEYIKEMMDYRELKGAQEALAPSLPKFDDNDELIGG